MPDFDPKNIPVLEDIIEEGVSELETTPDDGVPDNTALDNAGLAETPRADENLDLFTAEPAPLDDEVHFDAPADPGEDLPVDEYEANPAESITATDATATDPPAEMFHIAGEINEFSEQPLSSFSAIDDSLTDDDSEDQDTIIDLAITQESSDTELNLDDVILAADSDIDEANNPSAWQQQDEDDKFIESALIDYQHPDTPSENDAGEHHHVSDNIIEPAIAEDDIHSEDETGYLVEAQQPQTKLAPTQEQEQQPGQYSQPIDIQPLIDDIIKQLMPDLEQQLRFLVRQALEDKLPVGVINDEEQHEERQK